MGILSRQLVRISSSSYLFLWNLFVVWNGCVEHVPVVSAFTTRASCPCPAATFVSQRHRLLSRRTVVVFLATSVKPAYTEDLTASSSSLSSSSLSEDVLVAMKSLRSEGKEFAEQFGLSAADAAFYALFRGITHARKTDSGEPLPPFGLKGEPFLLRHAQVTKALQQDSSCWPGFFTMTDLEKAVNDDFLDASRGSVDNRKGWKSREVSSPRGDSFEEARMTFEDVQKALEKGTVIFNSAGSHIPKLAGPSLACTDAAILPCALNLYVTASGLRTSAPPHTDKQDVVVIQTTGRKHWRVYSPPNPALRPAVEMFARGKGTDNLPLHALESEWNCTLLLEATLHPGDVLYIPAAFPHTTNTVLKELESDNDKDTTTKHNKDDDTSIHLTVNFDTHVWGLDYLSARRLALRRAGVIDTALGQTKDEDNRYTGKINEIPSATRADLLDALPTRLLVQEENDSNDIIDFTAKELERISRSVCDGTASAVNDVDASVWRDSIVRVRQEGMELVDIHRDMYLAAIQEGQERDAEDAMTAHLHPATTPVVVRKRVMTPERMERLSIFRVKRFFDKINESMAALNNWSYEGKSSTTSGSASATARSSTAVPTLPENWAFTLPLAVGDKVEADLGGAFFPATVTAIHAAEGTFDVQYFDGDRETGMDRSMIKLLSPPKDLLTSSTSSTAASSKDDVDTSNMTPKQLKRWKKQHEKLNKN